MTSLSFVFMCVFIVLLLIAQASSQTIQCYECVGAGCSDKFDPNANGVTQTSCTGSCLKAKSGDVVIRMCNDLGKEDGCVEKDNSHACLCDTNLCNGSSTITYSILSIAAMASLALVAAMITRM